MWLNFLNSRAAPPLPHHLPSVWLEIQNPPRGFASGVAFQVYLKDLYGHIGGDARVPHFSLSLRYPENFFP